MLKVELHNPRGDGGTVPCFATRTEIEVAQQLRHQLEKRLLAPSTSPSPLPARSSDILPEETPGPGTRHQHKHKQA